MTDIMTQAAPQNPGNQQVPLDTIPISPDGGTSGANENSEASNAAFGVTEPITVFHDPENFNVKHPLMNTWTLWFTKPPSGKVCSFDSCLYVYSAVS